MARRMSSASSSTSILLVRSPEQSSRHTITPPLASMVRPTLLMRPPEGQPVSRMRLAPAGTALWPAWASATRCSTSFSTRSVKLAALKLNEPACSELMSSVPFTAGGVMVCTL